MKPWASILPSSIFPTFGTTDIYTTLSRGLFALKAHETWLKLTKIMIVFLGHLMRIVTSFLDSVVGTTGQV